MSDTFTLGVYPFGPAGGPDGVAAGPADDFGQIRRLLRILQGDGAELLVRTYVAWSGADTTDTALGQIADLVGTGLRWDLVLAYRDREADIRGWTEFVSRAVTDFAADLAAIQVTGEANLTGIPNAGDGAYPGAIEALVHGRFAAATVKRQRALDVAVGFAVVPEREPAAGTFWPAVAALGGSRFQAVGEVLRTFRHKALPLAGITNSTPIRICENGWPTGPDRPEGRQAEVLEEVLRAVHARRHELNVTHCELLALRDADSTRANPFHRFGIVRDDYSPKPAFDRLRQTFAELR